MIRGRYCYFFSFSLFSCLCHARAEWMLGLPFLFILFYLSRRARGNFLRSNQLNRLWFWASAAPIEVVRVAGLYWFGFFAIESDVSGMSIVSANGVSLLLLFLRYDLLEWRWSWNWDPSHRQFSSPLPRNLVFSAFLTLEKSGWGSRFFGRWLIGSACFPGFEIFLTEVSLFGRRLSCVMGSHGTITLNGGSTWVMAFSTASTFLSPRN